MREDSRVGGDERERETVNYVQITHTARPSKNDFRINLSKLGGVRRLSEFIRTSIHDEYDLMLCWHVFFVYLAGVNEF